MSLVTVCIATFNRAALLSRSVESVRAQTHKDLQIIIVDDASSDETSSVAQTYAATDSRITCLRHNENHGLGAARNTAIQHAAGKYFTFIDDDDQWESSVIEKFVAVAEHYDSNWCFCCGYISKTRGRPIRYDFPKQESSLKAFIAAGWTPPVAGQFYSTDTVRRVCGYNERISSGVDHDLWLKLAVVDINIRTVQGCYALPDVSVMPEKATTNEERRRRDLEKSLIEWRELIETSFGREFYRHFIDCYQYYLSRKFFVLHAKRGNIAGVCKSILISPSKIWLIRSAIGSLIDRMNRSDRRTLTPVFMPFDARRFESRTD